MQNEKDFSRLNELFNDPEPDLRQVLIVKNLVSAIVTQQMYVYEFILLNIQHILEIGLENDEREEKNVRSGAMSIVTMKCGHFNSKLISNEDFLGYLSNFLRDFNAKKLESIKNWARVMSNCVLFSNGGILVNFPERKLFFKRIIPFIHIGAIYSLLYQITDDGHSIMNEFLEKTRASSQIFAFIGSNTKTECIFQLLSNIVSSSDSESTLITALAKQDRVDIIMSYVLTPQNGRVRDSAMKLVFELCSHCDTDECDEDSLFQTVFMKIVGKLNELSYFIESKPYCYAQEKIIELMIGMVSILPEVPPEIYTVLSVLWKRIWEFPLLSQSHCSLLKLFRVLIQTEGKCENILESLRVKGRIIDAFADPVGNRMIIGYLFEISKSIIESEEKSEYSPEWLLFIKGPYESMKSVIERGYGGEVPKKHKPALDELNIEGNTFNTVQGFPSS